MINAYRPRIRLLLLCITLMFAWTVVSAQVRTISGVIIRDSDKQPVPGVTIRVKGANTGTSTDDKGRYTLANVPANATLVITAIGFQTQELPVNGRQQIDISLAESSKGLNEVLVVGYGTQKKSDLTGAIASVNGAELNKRIATDPVQLLQGKMPGLSLTQGSGEAGNEGSVLRVRGLGTYSSAGSSPLVIVDGLPGNLTVLDPQNIESVTLLKDAASAAIYGTRAANGVLLVTTKQGKAGRFQLSYDYSIGITKPTALPDNLIYNSAQYMQMYNVAAANSGYGNRFTPEMIAAYTNPSDPVRYPNFNWLDAVMRTVQVHTHHIGMTGGSNGTVYNIGIGYVDQPDIMIGFSYKKYNLQFNLNSKINEWATFGSSVTLNYGKRTYASRGSQDMFLSTLSQSPMYGPKLPDGSGRYVNSVYPSVQTPNKNPVAIAENALVNSNDYFLQSSLFLNIRLLKGLEWRTSGGLNFNFNKVYDFKPVISQYNWFAKPNDLPERPLDVNGQGLVVTDSNMVYPVGYTQLTYTKAINKHNFKLLVGTHAEYNKSQRMVGSRNTPFPSNSLHELNAGPAGSQIATGTSAEWALRSYYGRLNYDYDEKYLLEVNARYDASSRFPPDNRWGLFPSVSAGWVLTRENFLHNIAWLNNLKLRGSWGKLGNQNIGNYPYQDVYTTQNAYNPNTGYAYSFSGNGLNSGVAQNGLVDANIKWETTRIFDVGADMTLFNKLDVTIDWYNKLTYDILYTPLIPAYLGLNAPTLNQGKMKNTGLEASLQYTDNIGNVRFSAGATFQTNKNKVIRFGAPSINTGNNTIIQ